MSKETKTRTGFATLVLVALALAAFAAIFISARGGVTSGGGSTERRRLATLEAILEAVPTAKPERYRVEYRVTGTASRASLTYENETGGTEQHTVSIPWSEVMFVNEGDFAYISAQNKGERGSVECQILLNGKVWKQAKSSGAYVIASCSGSVGD